MNAPVAWERQRAEMSVVSGLKASERTPRAR